ncbi:trichohyalin-like [Teleopsis dalmanni]|uniref:trichohyalin-like n=1 Tax=Teleopsis dalmanni TaxID=139649 RepID=UPI0018CEAA2F|nr:trichohyalin-like [Teleopsis dalmanni]XP_037938118.1 trichohyalin-like [Teleopsis dalmanni]
MQRNEPKMTDEKIVGEAQKGCDELKTLCARNTIILSANRYDKIRKNITKYEVFEKELEEEKKYSEYLKEGSDKLVAKFGGNYVQTTDQALKQKELLEAQAEERLRQSQLMYEAVLIKEEEQRKKKVEEAKEVLEKMRNGPRELRGAALHSEVLRCRNVQMAINKEFEKAVKKQECADMVNIDKHGMAFIQEEQQRMANNATATNNYKRELIDAINEKCKARVEERKQAIRDFQEETKIIQNELKNQVDKEKAAMERKRAILRQNALEAMKMVEQRRQRERLGDEIDDGMACVYGTGVHQLMQKQAETKKMLHGERLNKIEENTKIFAQLPTKEEYETKVLRRDISRDKLKFTAEEQEKVRREKASKQARIEAYLEEVERQKLAKHRAEEQRRFEMAQRLKNNEVTCQFNESEKQKRQRQAFNYRSTLNDQIEYRRRNLYAQKPTPPLCQDVEDDVQHRYFFKYARNLMEDAKKKDRPLYPFVRVVNEYKRANQINCDRKVPRHLVSNINVGHQSYNPNCKYQCNSPQRRRDFKPRPAPDEKDKESILANCLRINQLVASVAGGGVMEKRSEVKSEKGCGDLLTDKPAECNEEKDKYVYTVQELKKMNKYDVDAHI